MRERRLVGPLKLHAGRVALYLRLRTLPILVVLVFTLFPLLFNLQGSPGVWNHVALSPFFLGYISYLVYIIWLARKQALALRYWIQQSVLRIDEGVIYLKRKSIPLDRITDVVSKVPVLGDIPLLNLLFRRTVKRTVKTELLIFLTPRVAEQPEELQKMSKDETSGIKAVREAGGPGAFEEHMEGMRRGAATRPAEVEHEARP